MPTLHFESTALAAGMSYMILPVLVALVPAAILLLFWPSTLRRWFSVASASRSKSRKRLPPGPKGWPIVGNLPHFGKGLEPTLAELARKYGGIVSIKLGSMPVVVVTSSSVARVVLQEQDSIFCSRPPPPAVFKYLSYLDEQMAFADYGPVYTFQRKMMMQELLNPQKVIQFKHHRESEFDALVKSIHHVTTVTASLSEAERAIPLRPFLRACFMNALSVTAISERLVLLPGELPGDSFLVPRPASSTGETITTVVDLTTCTLMISDLFPAWGFLDSIFMRPLQKHLTKIFAMMDGFLQQAVEQRRLLPRENEARGVLDILLSLRYTDNEGQEQPLTDRGVKGNIQIMILGSVDNTSTILEWLLAELVSHPDCMNKLQEEMDEVVGKHRTVEEADLPKLPYLRAVLKETMRLHPLGPLLFPRRCNKDTVVDGYHVAANTVALIYVNAAQRDPAVWPDPDQFRPERFLNWKGPDITRGQHFSFMPFGSGRRMCPGFNLATAMLDLATARLLHSFDWSLPGELKHRPQDLCMRRGTAGMALKVEPLKLIVTRRSRA